VNFCVPCLRGQHTGCKAVLLAKPDYCECLHGAKETSQNLPEKPLDDSSLPSLFSTDSPDEVITIKSRRQKPDGALKDQQSTGRKRAAKLYPLDREATCEWANKTECGGGNTISGCGIRMLPSGLLSPVGKQQSRHHGPDYNTLNNDPGNVHRICHSCHNAWHAVNDSDKDEAYLKLYGVKPSKEALSTAAKELRSGGPSEA